MANQGTWPILETPTAATPASYTIAQLDPVDLLAVRAIFDGTGAGGAFLPKVEIQDGSGNVIVHSQGSSVAAGGQAEVSFSSFLRSTAAAASSLTATTASYASGTVNVAQNATGFLPLSNAPYFGSDMFDRSTPASPKVLTAGIYSFMCVFRCVIALGGAQAAGTTFLGNITAGGGQSPKALFTWGSAGSFVPQQSCTFIPVQLAANTVVSFAITNSDSAAGNHTYDSPDVTVTKLS
jgi:hypothetical protein